MTGTFVVLDGPSGVVKSAVSHILAYRLTNAGQHTVVTREPFDGPIGLLARTATSDYFGIARPASLLRTGVTTWTAPSGRRSAKA